MEYLGGICKRYLTTMSTKMHYLQYGKKEQFMIRTCTGVLSVVGCTRNDIPFKLTTQYVPVKVC